MNKSIRSLEMSVLIYMMLSGDSPAKLSYPSYRSMLAMSSDQSYRAWCDRFLHNGPCDGGLLPKGESRLIYVGHVSEVLVGLPNTVTPPCWISSNRSAPPAAVLQDS
uniref:Uncharacterized protein n=1 Tax=Coccidioides posadasii RMSCC 3488 TaxID=454284 RepID=A0A0J6FGL7_COCPO|nr:hypothetical protein CPAG_08573 [Coccidioides posadasii RMSCC 3488]